ncbi:hypothetical protein BVRB_2g033070 isoform C [Beta vulgaris subsp. vulgaris]|uniref:Neprosin PEP catalytic domain-containing protein n=1 Tax=Beta vulgaris subsp. vulgaris TaxID=3555 RepID=A0A0J8FQB2_BETVV|nr:hypothetical protein BVRB_2g033070 isoform C [Beta vulgaris subsp. vulgaris]
MDCIDIYKQPAFNHPALRKHKIQMAPSSVETMKMGVVSRKLTRKEDSKMIQTYQLWRKNGSCPTGTIPIRRIRATKLLNCNSAENCGRKGPSFPDQLKKSNDNKAFHYLQANHSLAILLTVGYNYNGAKAEMKVYTPHVEHDDEYSTSRIALKTGPSYSYESVESGWAVNPSVYGDRETRLYTYWTVDSSNATGCFDLTCPGFVQTSNEIALGGVIRSIPVPGGLPWSMTIHIVRDPITMNWWLQYQENITVGYWPAEIFEALSATAETVQWGGEVSSSRLGHPGHTSTEMGSGEFPDHTFETSGWIKKIRIQDNSMVLKIPEWLFTYTDDYECYNVYIHREYFVEPKFYFGGPGKGWQSWRSGLNIKALIGGEVRNRMKYNKRHVVRTIQVGQRCESETTPCSNILHNFQNLIKNH